MLGRRAKIKEKYVLMSEPDHIWLRPMPNLMKVHGGFVCEYLLWKRMRESAKASPARMSNCEAVRSARVGTH